MTTQIVSNPSDSRINSLMAAINAVWQFNRPMTSLIIVSTIVTILAGIGIGIDERIVVGAPIWAKTTKFAISFIVYGATLLWMFSYIEGQPRFVRYFLNSTAILLYVELGLLITQAVRGRMMHFNYATFIDGTLYTTMAISIFILWGVSIITALLMLRQHIPDKALAWGIKLGLMLSIGAGFGVGTLMTSPTENQLAKIEAGLPDAGDIIGAHTVGAEDGGPGLPLLGWSTTHGDLRIPHFFGLHALQVIPAIGWVISRQRNHWLHERHKLALVVIGAVGYTGWLGLITWQALRGQSIVAPDALTATTFVALVGVIATSVVTVVGHAYYRGNITISGKTIMKM